MSTRNDTPAPPAASHRAAADVIGFAAAAAERWDVRRLRVAFSTLPGRAGLKVRRYGVITATAGTGLKCLRVREEPLRAAKRREYSPGLQICAPPNIALQRTRCAPLREPLSFGTFGGRSCLEAE